MNLWFSIHFLFAGLYLSSSAPTPEECQQLVKPLSLDDHSVMHGRLNFILGYTDSEVFNSILKVTESSWMKITPSPDDAHKVLMSQENKMNGTCIGSEVNVTIKGDTAVGKVANVTSSFHVLESCSDCLVLSINSTSRDFSRVLDTMKLNIPAKEEIVARAFYLFSRESTVKDSDLEHAKKQASCLGFTKEPDFHYDSKKEFCTEGEGTRLTFT
ncbi:uncharacterized protein LOC121913688 isoform X1 [Thunnus maccoyii]|uniref:uncharacterized protein LOC121913688 isoform X1 n=2 Tax=Thunnus maccoyii TaxID=8240 RepID=UPI001C4D0601|nr:uncharacterized protein LOC121913688 isoform X1 [Thunnus maccoyii]